jgi:nitroreductase
VDVATAPAPAGIEALLRRRSVPKLVGPAPDDTQIALLLQCAMTVPDHGELRPWRFVVLRGEGRNAFGAALADAAAELDPDLPPERREKMAAKPLVAPAAIVLVLSPRASDKIQPWEQQASAACTGHAILLAADALGLGAVWKSTPFTTGTSLRSLLELTAGERLMGWINVGQPGPAGPPGRPRPAVSEVATVLSGSGPPAPFGA